MDQLETYVTLFCVIAVVSWIFSFGLDSILFLLVGLNLRIIVEHISAIPFAVLLNYGVIVILTVILGRFILVFGTMFLPRYLPFGAKITAILILTYKANFGHTANGGGYDL